MGFHMTGWDHEFAVPFINEGLFHVLEQATVLMTTQLPSLIGARRMAYAKKLVQMRQAVNARRARERAKDRMVALTSICTLALLLTFGLFLASAN
jgi:hypothetical protein